MNKLCALNLSKEKKTVDSICKFGLCVVLSVDLHRHLFSFLWLVIRLSTWFGVLYY